MDQSVLPLFSLGMLVGSVFLAFYLLFRAWKSHSLTLLLFSLVDLMFAAVLPLLLVNSISLGTVATEKLFLAGFLFYLVTFLVCLFFPSTAQRFLIPIASLYLIFASLQSSALFFQNRNLEFELALFAYELTDDITEATFSELVIAILIPVYRNLGSRISALFDSKRLDDTHGSTPLTANNYPSSFSFEEESDYPRDSRNRLLRNALRFLSRREYKLCVESCDAEIGRIIMQRFLQSRPKLDAPVGLEEQLSTTKSLGLHIQARAVLRLRKLRNALTKHSTEATFDQAKWAIRVLRATMKAVELASRSPESFVQS